MAINGIENVVEETRQSFVYFHSKGIPLVEIIDEKLVPLYAGRIKYIIRRDINEQSVQVFKTLETRKGSKVHDNLTRTLSTEIGKYYPAFNNNLSLDEDKKFVKLLCGILVYVAGLQRYGIKYRNFYDFIKISVEGDSSIS